MSPSLLHSLGHRVRSTLKSVVPAKRRQSISRLIRGNAADARHRFSVSASNPNNALALRSFASLYARSMLGSLKYRHEFDDVRTYCMFLGYPRSGHSLVGALLDAHPEILIAHEVDVLGLLEWGPLSQRQVFSMLMENSRWFAEHGRSWSGYSYAVPGQWQGKFEKLQVIGDKKGGTSTVRLGRQFNLLEKLENTVGMETRYIHHMRNPYDCISTMCRVRRQQSVTESAVDAFFSMCDVMMSVKQRIPSSRILDGRHEDLVDDPRAYLERLCKFLNVACSDDYLAACGSIVFASPHQSRKQLEWPPGMVDAVAERIGGYEFLSGYDY